MKARFVCKYDEEYGISGWVPKNKPYFDPGGGQLVAHDILEEFPNGGEQPEDEFMALGSMLYGRANYGMIGSQNYSIAKVLCNEASEIFRHILHEDGYQLKKAPNTKPLKNENFDWIEEHIMDFAFLFPNHFIEEIEYELGSFETVSELENSRNTYLSQYLPPETIIDAVSWLRIGVRKAHKRYFSIWDAGDIGHMFEKIRNKVDKLTNIDVNDELQIRIDMYSRDLQVEYIPWCELKSLVFN